MGGYISAWHLGIIGLYFLRTTEVARFLLLRNGMWQWSRTFLHKSCKTFQASIRGLHQDGATAHTFNTAMPVVRQLFSNKVMSRRGGIPGPQRSLDLTLIDFFYGVILKVKCLKPNDQLMFWEKISDRKWQALQSIPAAQWWIILEYILVCTGVLRS